jgi:putative two-component system response regulator
LPHEQCVELIAEASGTQFDPRVVEVFLQIEDRIRQLAEQYQNADKSSESSDLGSAGQQTRRDVTPWLNQTEALVERAVRDH